MKKRVIISVTSDLTTDNRIQKVANSLKNANFEVIVVARKTKQSLPFSANYKVHRFRTLFTKSFLFYAEFNILLFFFLLLSKADIFLANDLDTLLPNSLAARLRKKKLIYDSHELFTEVPELHNRHLVKKIWSLIESHILPKVKYCYTVCNSVANYYNKKYGTKMQVVCNVPLKTDFVQENLLLRQEFPSKKIILYQGALNVGRGIEWVIDAMPFIDNAVFLIIGDGDIRKKLEIDVEQKQLQDKVYFLGKISSKELPSYTRCADLGVCLLSNNSLSYYYSLPNRIFDFMHARVPILASNFPEIANIINHYKIGECIEKYDPKSIAATISRMLNSCFDKSIFDIAIKENSWQNEEKTLLKIFNNALDSDTNI